MNLRQLVNNRQVKEEDLSRFIQTVTKRGTKKVRRRKGRKVSIENKVLALLTRRAGRKAGKRKGARRARRAVQSVRVSTATLAALIKGRRAGRKGGKRKSPKRSHRFGGYSY